MEKTVYITEEEREKCRKVIDVFEELYEIEDEDILLVDVGRYGFVKLQCYTASHGFEELDTYTDSNSLFEGLWEEWLSLNVFLLAREMQLADVLCDTSKVITNKPKKMRPGSYCPAQNVQHKILRFHRRMRFFPSPYQACFSAPGLKSAARLP